MDASLYHEDYHAWTVAQAAALRTLSVRQPSNEVDRAHLIEEVEDLGKDVVRAVRSALRRLMEHAALLALVPEGHREARRWLVEMRIFRAQAVDDYAPSMRRMVLATLQRDWQLARDRAAAKLRTEGAALPDALPFTLDDLLQAVAVETLPARLGRVAR